MKGALEGVLDHCTITAAERSSAMLVAAATLPLALLFPGLHDLLQVAHPGAIPVVVAIAVAILSVVWRVQGVRS